MPIGELASTLDSIDLRNRNTYRRVDVKDIIDLRQDAAGGLHPGQDPLRGR